MTHPGPQGTFPCRCRPSPHHAPVLIPALLLLPAVLPFFSALGTEPWSHMPRLLYFIFSQGLAQLHRMTLNCLSAQVPGATAPRSPSLPGIKACPDLPSPDSTSGFQATVCWLASGFQLFCDSVPTGLQLEEFGGRLRNSHRALGHWSVTCDYRGTTVSSVLPLEQRAGCWQNVTCFSLTPMQASFCRVQTPRRASDLHGPQLGPRHGETGLECLRWTGRMAE